MNVLKQTKITAVLLLLCGCVGVSTLVPASSVAAKDKGVTCSILPKSICDKAGSTSKDGHSAIWSLLILVLNILTAGIGVAAVIGIIVASILYASAEDKADQVHKAKMMIWNIVLGLIMYLAMYTFLQFIIPGGVFS